MAAEKRSFEELLRDAPEAAAEDAVSLVGTLARSKDADKFVLTLSGGQAVTLDVSAVKNHEVLGNAVGQPIVRIEVDRDCLPTDLDQGATPVAADTAVQRFTAAAWDPSNGWSDPMIFGIGANQIGRTPEGTPVAEDTAFTVPQFDTIHTRPWFDWVKAPWMEVPQSGRTLAPLDYYPTIAWFDNPHTGIVDVITNPLVDQGGITIWSDPGSGTLQENIPDPAAGGVDPAAQVAATPFSLATQHQAPPSVMAALGALKPRHDPKTHADPGGTHQWWDPPGTFPGGPWF